jgi:hypothetical protein
MLKESDRYFGDPVLNSEVFFDDMQYVVRRIKKLDSGYLQRTAYKI